MCGLVPGVMAQTGMECLEIIKGVVSEVKPDFVVTIDALAARSTKRLGCTIQLTDTGIVPGSGVETTGWYQPWQSRSACYRNWYSDGH